jgi:hypothetical protein
MGALNVPLGTDSAKWPCLSLCVGRKLVHVSTVSASRTPDGPQLDHTKDHPWYDWGLCASRTIRNWQPFG